MADDDNIPPEGARPAPRRALVCEFCESRLSAAGEVMTMGGKAKGFAKIEQRMEQLDADLARARTRITELETEAAELRAKLSKADDDDDAGAWG